MVDKEQRRFSRVDFHTRAEITKGTISIKGDVKNISLKGAFVASNEKLPTGQNVDILIELTGLKYPLKVSIKGRIVRTTSEGMGIDFDSMDLDTFTTLKEIVSYNLGNDTKPREEILRYLEERINKE